jgi:hypothetical protein
MHCPSPLGLIRVLFSGENSPLRVSRSLSEHARGRAVSGIQDQHFGVYGVGGMGVREAWMVLTDLPPCEVSGGWHRYRSGIEQGFGDWKRLGWSCHRTLVRDAAR